MVRARSSAEEHYVDIVGVTGSIPVAPTIQLIRKTCFLDAVYPSGVERTGKAQHANVTPCLCMRDATIVQIRWPAADCSDGRIGQACCFRSAARQALGKKLHSTRQTNRQLTAQKRDAARRDVDNALTGSAAQIALVEQGACERRSEMAADMMPSLRPVETQTQQRASAPLRVLWDRACSCGTSPARRD